MLCATAPAPSPLDRPPHLTTRLTTDTGVYRAGGVEADYIATEPISLWASAAGPNVLHTVRAAQAFSIIGSVLKVPYTIALLRASPSKQG